MFLRRMTFLFVAFIFSLPAGGRASGPGATGYAGSEACRKCHERIYRQWKATPHANMLRDAKKDPGAVAATDFSRVPFRREDILWSVGSHWVQKYLTLIDNEYYVLPNAWDLVKGEWEPFSIFNWRERPYTQFCDGCHATGYDPATKSFHEPSIGCEACHGPGEKHAGSREPKDIVNPDKLPNDRRDMICESCHTDGKDTRAGGRFPFPAFYRPGDDLTRYYSDFTPPKPRSKKWYRGTMDYRERHRMYLFWQSRFYSTNRACDICGFDRGITVKEERYMTRDEYCGTCHKEIYATGSGHSRHAPQSVHCVDCHTPQVAAGGNRYSIHDHKFDFSGPELPCSECHTEKETAGKKAPPHDFPFRRVELQDTLTLEQACARCHTDRDHADTLRNGNTLSGSVE